MTPSNALVTAVTIRKREYVASRRTFPISIVVKTKWASPRASSESSVVRLPLTLSFLAPGSRPSADRVLEAVGLLHPSEFSELSADTDVPPGSYRLTWRPPDSEPRSWRFDVLKDPHAPLRLRCQHRDQGGSFHDLLSVTTPKGELGAVWGESRLEACCRDLLLHNRPAVGNEYALVYRQPVTRPLSIIQERRTWTARAGEYLLANPQAMTTYPSEVKFPLHWRHLTVYQPFLRPLRDTVRLAPHAGPFDFAPGPHPVTPELEAALTLIVDSLRPDAMIGRWPYAEMAVQAWLLILLRDHPNRLHHTWTRQGGWLPTDPRLKIAMDYLAAHFHRKLEITEVAEEAGMSADRLRKLMQQHIGVSPNEYLQTLRVDKAKALLQSSTRTVEEVARAVGIQDPRHFRRLFHKLAGRSAGTFR